MILLDADILLRMSARLDPDYGRTQKLVFTSRKNDSIAICQQTLFEFGQWQPDHKSSMDLEWKRNGHACGWPIAGECFISLPTLQTWRNYGWNWSQFMTSKDFGRTMRDMLH